MECIGKKSDLQILNIEKDLKFKFYFKQLIEEYPNDRMILFEKAITCECLKLYTEALNLYSICLDENTGLIVKHWRDVAFFFKQRVLMKKEGYPQSNEIEDNLKAGNIDSEYACKWNAFYYIHSFVNFPNHIRYLAISSLARCDSESEMAAIIFRTCMEEAFKNLFPNYKSNDSWLNEFIKESNFLPEYIIPCCKIIQKKWK